MLPIIASLTLAVSCVAVEATVGIGGQYYTAAVLEHAPIGSYENLKSLIDDNFAVYKNAARVAKNKGADIIVYPEFGICRSGQREDTKRCGEIIPDPNGDVIRPCADSEVYSSYPILSSFSCIAKTYSIVVVGSMPDVQPCVGECGCPPDGVFVFNTNVVFDRNGTLILKYHKEHLVNEPEFDIPKTTQRPVFETDFGRFSTYTCYDLNFAAISEVSREARVDGVAVPANWDDEVPFGISIQTFEARARATNLTLLIADINVPEIGSFGSGVFNGWEGTLGYTYNPDGVSKLVVARAPRYGQKLDRPESSVLALNDKNAWVWTKDGRDVPVSCSDGLVSKNDYRTTPCSLDDHHVYVPLRDASGYVHACNNGMCCSVSYSTSGLKDDFFLAIYNGTKPAPAAPDYCIESCGITICRLNQNKTCDEFPFYSDTEFLSIRLIGNFSSEEVLPTVLESGARLLRRNEWTYDACASSQDHMCLTFDDRKGRKIISAGLLGRCYGRDQMYSTPGCSSSPSLHSYPRFAISYLNFNYVTTLLLMYISYSLHKII